jgi:hypothetical protein
MHRCNLELSLCARVIAEHRRKRTRCEEEKKERKKGKKKNSPKIRSR